jgi:hypothetical protein
MKKFVILLAVVFLVTIAWVRINRETYPLPPARYEVQSKTVTLKFKVSNADLNSVELALNEGSTTNNMFVMFELSDGWINGNFGLVLKDMSEKSNFSGNSGRKPDISRFEKDNSGNRVNFYTFEQVLVKDENGINYIQMRYTGAPMLLIQNLKIEKPVRVPRNISARFGNQGNIEFQPGSFGLDAKTNGFWIPVKIS